LDENDEIQELESSWSLTKKQGEGFVSFSGGRSHYHWLTVVWMTFGVLLLSFILFAGFVGMSDAIMTGSLGGGVFFTLFIVGISYTLYEAILALYEEVLGFIHSNTYLVLTREHLELRQPPFKILKQKILIKDIESIDIQWQRFFWGGEKIPIERVKERLTKYGEEGYSSFKVNLHNKKVVKLNFKLRDSVVAEQLSRYILTPQKFSVINTKKANSDGVVFNSKDDKLEIYSQRLVLSKEEVAYSKGELKKALKMLSVFFILFMVGLKPFLMMGLLIVFLVRRDLFLLLKNARIKKIEVTPSLLTESRIGLFLNLKNKLEFTKEEIDSFFIKQQEHNNKYSISMILKKGISHDLSIQFKEKKTAEEILQKMQEILFNKDKICIKPASSPLRINFNKLEGLFDRAVDDENQDMQ